MDATETHVYMPGDIIEEIDITNTRKSVILGPGIIKDDNNAKATRSGILKCKDKNTFWVDSRRKRYVPVRGEHVIGIVTAKAGDTFRIDIGSSEQASLSYLSFEGATKRNRPDVKIGDLVYGRILSAHKDMEPELVCIDGNGKAAGLGVIKEEGLMVKCSLNLVERILTKSCDMLTLLGSRMPYEVAVGMNGRVWVKGRSVPETIAVARAITNSEFKTHAECAAMVNSLMDKLAGFS